MRKVITSEWTWIWVVITLIVVMNCGWLYATFMWGGWIAGYLAGVIQVTEHFDKTRSDKS